MDVKRGNRSRCFISQPKSISKLDRSTILSAYPAAVAQQDRESQRRATQMGGIFGQLNLDAAQLGIAGIRISNSIKHFGRRLKLQFPVSSDGFVRRSPTGAFNRAKAPISKLP